MIEPLIYKAVEAEKKLEENFEADGKTYLVRCPKCKRENYAMAVSSGVCAWCGYDINKELEELEGINQKIKAPFPSNDENGSKEEK